MRWKNLFTASAISMIAGCASPLPQPEARPARIAPASLTTACAERLPEPRNASMGALLEAYIATARQYHDCRDRQEGAAGLIRNRN